VWPGVVELHESQVLTVEDASGSETDEEALGKRKRGGGGAGKAAAVMVKQEQHAPVKQEVSVKQEISPPSQPPAPAVAAEVPTPPAVEAPRRPRRGIFDSDSDD
jgi:hypothetical protein